MPDAAHASALPGRLLARMRAGEVLLGPLLFDLATPGLAVTLAEAGFDFVLFDLEHAPLDAPTVSAFMLAARHAGLASVVKLPDLERSSVQRYLDYGAAGIQIPHVESADEARRLAVWGRYPPRGERGQVFGLGNTGFRAVDRDGYVAEANDSVLLIAMIETRRGVERVEEILGCGGDGGGGGVGGDAGAGSNAGGSGDNGPNVVFIGTGDLSSSYGVPGQMTHPIVLEAAERVVATCRVRGIATAINAETPETARHWIERGVSMIAYSSDLGMIRRQSALLLEPLADLRARQRPDAGST